MTTLTPVSEWRTFLGTAVDIGCFEQRRLFTQRYGWFILTDEVAKRLSSFIKDKTVVEVFAGTGYLASHLRTLSGLSRKEYRAYDNRGWANYYINPTWKNVVNKNAFMAPIKKANVVIMCWPPYDTNHGERIVKKMVSGQYLVMNGEGYGGCTGNEEMHEYVSTHFVHLEVLSEYINDDHVSFFGINDRWSIYRKL